MSYTTVNEINRGGFGVVERVFDDNNRDYARKTFSPSPSIPVRDIEKHRQRFVREVRYQKNLPQEYAVTILDENLEGPNPWFIMPLLDKTYADQILEDRKAGTISKEPLMDVLNALDELHDLGFVHRDLKPQNILLHEGKWKLGDFGLLLPPSGNTTPLTSTNSAWGTETYAAPEQVTDFRTVKATADIFAFGCILHDLVDGNPRVPYSRLTCTGPLGLVIEKCTEIDPGKRFRNVRALRGALVSILAQPLNLQPSIEAQEWIVSLKDYKAWDAVKLADFAKYIKNEEDSTARWEALNLLDEEFWEWSFASDQAHAEEIAYAFAEWAHGGFNWDYCDVLIRRLELVFELADISVKAAVAVAAAVLGSSHNRWFVMRRVKAMCSPNLDDIIARRVAIEIQANEVSHEFENCLDGSEPDDVYHPVIRQALGA